MSEGLQLNSRVLPFEGGTGWSGAAEVLGGTGLDGRQQRQNAQAPETRHGCDPLNILPNLAGGRSYVCV
jgi:hypothetical protein